MYGVNRTICVFKMTKKLPLLLFCRLTCELHEALSSYHGCTVSLDGVLKQGGETSAIFKFDTFTEKNSTSNSSSRR